MEFGGSPKKRASIKPKFSSIQKLEHELRMIYAGFPSLLALGFGNGHVPTFWLLQEEDMAIGRKLRELRTEEQTRNARNLPFSTQTIMHVSSYYPTAIMVLLVEGWHTVPNGELPCETSRSDILILNGCLRP